MAKESHREDLGRSGEAVASPGVKHSSARLQVVHLVMGNQHPEQSTSDFAHL